MKIDLKKSFEANKLGREEKIKILKKKAVDITRDITGESRWIFIIKWEGHSILLELSQIDQKILLGTFAENGPLSRLRILDKKDYDSPISTLEIFLINDTEAEIHHLSQSDQLKLSGTEILKFSLDFLKWLGYKKIVLLDKATVICDNGKEFYLSLYYLFKKGITWYESKGFRPITEEKERYKKLRSRALKVKIGEIYNDNRKLLRTLAKCLAESELQDIIVYYNEMQRIRYFTDPIRLIEVITYTIDELAIVNYLLRSFMNKKIINKHEPLNKAMMKIYKLDCFYYHLIEKTLFAPLYRNRRQAFIFIKEDHPLVPIPSWYRDWFELGAYNTFSIQL